MIFEKMRLGKYTLQNKIAISPMCQYSSINGEPNSWHYSHYGNLIKSGAGMLCIESTSVSLAGKITKGDLALYTKKQGLKFKEFVKFLKSINKKVPIILQISHAGRKASSYIPWVKNNKPLAKQFAWKTYAPSSLKKDKNWPLPEELNKNKINKIINEFVNTALLAKKSGFDGIEIHMAHGYLVHQFLSPISNKRKDFWGGNNKNRMRFAIEITKRIKNVLKNKLIIGARIAATDHLKNGISIKDGILLVKELDNLKLDYFCLSSGGIKTKTKLNFKKGFRLKYCEYFKKKINAQITTVGGLDSLTKSQPFLKKNKINFLTIGRKFLLDSMWLFKLKDFSKILKKTPKQYLRGFR